MSKPAQLSGLKRKLIITMTIVGTLPLLFAIVISFTQGNKSLEEVLGASFQALAQETSKRLDLVLEEEIAQNIHFASHPTLILTTKANSESTESVTLDSVKQELAEESSMWDEQNPEITSLLNSVGSRILKNFMAKETVATQATRALYIVNNKGALVSSINSYPQYLNHEKAFFKNTINGGKGSSWFGKIRLDPKLKEYVFDIAVPLVSHDDIVYGVFHRVYNPKDFLSRMVESITFGETGHVMVINSEGVVIDCPILPSGFQLPDPELVKSVTGPRGSWARTQGDGHGSKQVSIIGYSPLRKTNMNHRSSVVDGWFSFAWQSSDELFAPTKKLLLWISVAGFISILLIGGMGSVAANKVVKPIKQLQSAAVRIGRGEQVEPQRCLGSGLAGRNLHRVLQVGACVVELLLLEEDPTGGDQSGYVFVVSGQRLGVVGVGIAVLSQRPLQIAGGHQNRRIRACQAQRFFEGLVGLHVVPDARDRAGCDAGNDGRGVEERSAAHLLDTCSAPAGEAEIADIDVVMAAVLPQHRQRGLVALGESSGGRG